jgi:hypothetical protein
MRRGIEVKCSLDDDHYVASWVYKWNAGAQVQHFMYVKSLIS